MTNTLALLDQTIILKRAAEVCEFTLYFPSGWIVAKCNLPLKNESLSVLSCAVGILILNRSDTKITNLSIYLVLEQNQHMYFVTLSVGVFSSQFT